MKSEKITDRLGTTYQVTIGDDDDGIILEKLENGCIRIGHHYDSGFSGNQEEVAIPDFLEALGLTERSQLIDTKLRILLKLADAADAWLDWDNIPNGEGIDELIAAICQYRGLKD